MNVPRLKWRPRRIERLFGRLNVGVLEAIPQRRELIVGVVVDREERSRPDAPPAARMAPVTFSTGTSSTSLDDANRLHAEPFGQRPAGVVVRRHRFRRAPVLIVEDGVGRPANTAGPFESGKLPDRKVAAAAPSGHGRR